MSPESSDECLGSRSAAFTVTETKDLKLRIPSMLKTLSNGGKSVLKKVKMVEREFVQIEAGVEESQSDVKHVLDMRVVKTEVA